MHSFTLAPSKWICFFSRESNQFDRKFLLLQRQNATHFNNMYSIIHVLRVRHVHEMNSMNLFEFQFQFEQLPKEYECEYERRRAHPIVPNPDSSNISIQPNRFCHFKLNDWVSVVGKSYRKQTTNFHCKWRTCSFFFFLPFE